MAATESGRDPPPLLDWRDASHFSRTARPCRYCGKPTQLRDSKRKPSHKVCAEQALAQQAADAADAYENEGHLMPTPQQRIWNQGYGGFQTPALRPQGWKKPKLTTAQREEIIRRLGEGAKSTDLATEYGVSGSTIRRLRQYVRPA